MKKVILFHFIILFFATPYLSAQNSNGSPYSMYGLGLLNDNHGPYTSLGGVSAAMRDNVNINFLNPASYTALDSNRFYLQLGIDGEYTRISTHQESGNYKVSQNAAFNIALRLYKKLFMSLGFNQRSSIGYNLYYRKLTGGTHNEYFTQHISGHGGLNDIYLGLAYQFGKLSVGVNSSLVFGNIEDRLRLYPPFDDSYSIFTQSRTSITDVIFDIGLQYKFNLTPNSQLTLGTTFNLPTKLNADKTFTSYKVNQGTGVQQILDELDIDNGNIKYPLRLNTGFAFDYKTKWTIAGDYTFHQMSDYMEFGEKGSNNTEFNDYHKGALGVSFLPARYGRYWWQRNRYNLGVYGTRSHLELKNTSINTIGVTLGTQVPVTISNRELMLGIGFDMGVRGTEKNGLIREQYAKVRLNIAFKEGWFMKRKIY